MRGPGVRIAFVGALVSSAVSLVVLGAASAPLAQEPRPVNQQQRPRKVASPQNNNSAGTRPGEKSATQPKENAAHHQLCFYGSAVRDCALARHLWFDAG